MENGIAESFLNEICFLAEIHGICKVVLYGPRARGDYKEDSDIDLAVSGGNIAAFGVDLQEASEKLKISVVDLNGNISIDLRESIYAEGETLYEK